MTTLGQIWDALVGGSYVDVMEHEEGKLVLVVDGRAEITAEQAAWIDRYLVDLESRKLESK